MNKKTISADSTQYSNLPKPHYSGMYVQEASPLKCNTKAIAPVPGFFALMLIHLMA